MVDNLKINSLEIFVFIPDIPIGLKIKQRMNKNGPDIYFSMHNFEELRGSEVGI